MADYLGVVVVVLAQVRIEQHAGHADDSVQRGPDFMAHVGQELGLGLICGFGVVLCVAQGGQGLPAFGHLTAQLLSTLLDPDFEVLPGVLQRGLRATALLYFMLQKAVLGLQVRSGLVELDILPVQDTIGAPNDDVE